MLKNLKLLLIFIGFALFSMPSFAIAPGAGQAQIRNNMQQMQQNKQQIKMRQQNQQTIQNKTQNQDDLRDKDLNNINY